MKHYLDIIDYNTTKCVKRFDVTGQTERQIDKLDRGVNINLNHEQYYTQEHKSNEELSLNGD